MIRWRGRTSDGLPRVRRLRLAIVLGKARVRQWMYTLDPNSVRWVPADVPSLLAQFAQTEAKVALDSFGKYVFPPSNSDERALAVESSSAETREWVEGFLDGGHGNAFDGAISLTQWLRGVAQQTMIQARVPVAIFWGEAGLFDVRLLSDERVEHLPDGSHRVHPARSHSRYQGQQAEPSYELPPGDLLIYERPKRIDGGGVPLWRAVPHYLNDLMSDQKNLATLYARATPQDMRLRAQLARVLPVPGASADRLPKSHVTRLLYGSMLERNIMGFDLDAPVTDYYLVWQHREVLRAGAAMRDHLLEFTADKLFKRSAEKAGLETTEVRVKPKGVPASDDIDAAFNAFVTGDIDKAEFHSRTRWW